MRQVLEPEIAYTSHVTYFLEINNVVHVHNEFHLVNLLRWKFSSAYFRDERKTIWFEYPLSIERKCEKSNVSYPFLQRGKEKQFAIKSKHFFMAAKKRGLGA